MTGARARHGGADRDPLGALPRPSSSPSPTSSRRRPLRRRSPSPARCRRRAVRRGPRRDRVDHGRRAERREDGRRPGLDRRSCGEAPVHDLSVAQGRLVRRWVGLVEVQVPRITRAQNAAQIGRESRRRALEDSVVAIPCVSVVALSARSQTTRSPAAPSAACSALGVSIATHGAAPAFDPTYKIRFSATLTVVTGPQRSRHERLRIEDARAVERLVEHGGVHAPPWRSSRAPRDRPSSAASRPAWRCPCAATGSSRPRPRSHPHPSRASPGSCPPGTAPSAACPRARP